MLLRIALMSQLARTHALKASTPQALAVVRALEEHSLAHMPQVDIETTHSLHAGCYARTIRIPANVMLTGALMKIPTLLVFSGDADVIVGDHSERLTGYHVLEGAADRKTAFIAYADTWLTMSFATQATTVEEAEREFTDEYERLMSRKN